MIPGKKYTPDDIVAIVWHWKWLLVLPAIVGGLVAFAYGRTLKEMYRSETVIMMTPQRVREDLVRSGLRTTLTERIQTISQQIMSRTRLEAIVVDFGLYEEDRRTGLMEDVIERMRRDLAVQMVRGDAFRVAYQSESPVTAMRVAERLAGLFIDENLKDREQLAQGTSQFLESQLEDARRRLIEQEKRLEAYRREHAGQLPSQVQSNLSAIGSAQMQAQQLQNGLSRDRDQLQLIERQIADANADGPEALPEPVLDSTAASVSGGSGAQQLEAARAALRNMSLRLKPEHPDIARMKRLIATLEQKAEKEALEVPLSAAGAPRSKAETLRVNRLAEFESAAGRLRKSIAAREGELQRLQNVVAEYQSRLDAAPTRETELIELTRDYDTLNRLYTSLLGKSEEAKLTVNLETRQVGQQFRVLDPARLPTRPYSPNRTRIHTMGVLGGAALGFGIVFLIVYRDSSLKTDEDVVTSLNLPVLALVPLMETTADIRRRRRRRLLLGGVSVVAVLGLVGGAAWWVVTRS